MVNELNTRGVSTSRGRRWTTHTLRRALRRMRRYKIEFEPSDEVLLAARRAAKGNAPEWSKGTLADWLPSLAPVVREIRAAGHLSTAAMVGELNERGVPTCHGGPWTMERIRVALRRMRKYKLEYDVALTIPFDAPKQRRPKRQTGRAHLRKRTRGPRKR
jgi:hypothetical protein